jgi:thiol:disulfide interchange protein DsbC
MLVVAGFVFILSVHPFAGAFDVKAEGCATDCGQCHEIGKEEAGEILKGVVDKVIRVEDGPVKGLWEVEVEARGSTFPLYLHYSKKYVIAGNIVEIESRKMVGSAAKPEKSPSIDLKKIPLDDAIIIGDPLARNTVIVFDDPDCPYCRKFHAVIHDVVSRRKDISFYIKLFPLVKLHPRAYEKSKAIVCERSVQLLNDAFAGKELPPAKCETDQIDRNMELGASLGISGTPTLILKNGLVIPGYLEADRLIEVVDRVDSKAGNGQ